MDVDLDFPSRNDILSHIDHTAAILENGSKHPSGVYITLAPQNPITGLASINYKKSEELGYFKIDFLNQSVYKMVKSPAHLEELISREPNWKKLLEKDFVNKLVHISNYSDMIKKLSEPIDSIEKLSMFLAIIRPGKKHLQGLPWNIISKTVWNRENNDGYTFRKSHSYAYAYLVILNINLLEEQGY
jgi:hypothetical protein